jgi:hypothetical protein
MRPPGRCAVALSAVQSLGLAPRRTRVHRRQREHLLSCSTQLARMVPEDMAHEAIAFLSDGSGTRDGDGRVTPRDRDPQ